MRLCYSLPSWRALAAHGAARGWSSAAAPLASRHPAAPSLLLRHSARASLAPLRQPAVAGVGARRALGCALWPKLLACTALMRPAPLRELMHAAAAPGCATQLALPLRHRLGQSHGQRLGQQSGWPVVAQLRLAHSYPVPSKKKKAGTMKYKLKTHQASKKRFRLTSKGWSHNWAGKQHLQVGNSRHGNTLKKRKPKLLKNKGFIKRLERLLPNKSGRRGPGGFSRSRFNLKMREQAQRQQRARKWAEEREQQRAAAHAAVANE